MARSRFVLRTRLAWLSMRVHWTMLLAIPFFWYLGREIWPALFGLIAWMVILLMHECGHALVARSVGLRIYAINLYPIHGVCEYATPHHEIDDVLVAWGGVAGQVLLLPLPMIALVSDWLFDAPAPHVLSLALTVLGPINLIMIATNLVPVPGLDGERAWRIFPLLRGKWRTAARRLWVRVSRAREVSRASAKALAADAIDRAKRRSKQLD